MAQTQHEALVEFIEWQEINDIPQMLAVQLLYVERERGHRVTQRGRGVTGSHTTPQCVPLEPTLKHKSLSSMKTVP